MAPDDRTGQLWSAVLSTLEGDARIPPSLRGFLDLVEPQGDMAGVLYLEVPNDLTRDMLEQRLRAPITEALVENAVEISSFKIVVNPQLDREPLPDVIDDPRADPVVAPVQSYERESSDSSARRVDSRLNPKYVFDNFVIGGSNRFAHAAALAVAETPAKAYNPLFIYGDSGLGKTHLLHAIGHYAEGMYPGIQVRYVSSEEFTNDFINSIANNLNQSFQQRYREVDVLLIDDIQFLKGKESTQEAFFHTFNTLHDHNKQVVITSDVAPKHLQGFEQRMVSRFEWGLITDVTAPDLETRIAILRKKAEAERIQIPPEVLSVIADKVQSNIRELEGTLIRVTAFASLNRLPVTMELAQTVLKDLFSFDEEAVVSPSDIISHTAAYFRLSVDDLHGSSRSQTIALARQIAMYLCREMTSMSLPKIGQLFGNRDHTTVMYANKKIEKLMQERRSVYTQVTELTARIRQRAGA
jgi:chromosomal replication initiator protein